MKKAFHNIVSILMAFVVLFSTMSFTIEKHFCGESLVDTALFSKLKSCGMEMESTTVNPLQSLDCSITKKNCCSDEHQTISGQDELQLNFHKISFDQHIFVAVFFRTYSTLFEVNEELIPYLPAYPPPNIVRHIYKLDESYLI